MDARLLQQDVNSLKFTAVKVDVTPLNTRRRQQVVVIISGNTSSHDVIKMVVQKIGMDRKQVALMQLIAVITPKSQHPDHCTDEYSSPKVGGRWQVGELVIEDDDCPAVLFNTHQKDCVSFRLKWKETDELAIEGVAAGRPVTNRGVRDIGVLEKPLQHRPAMTNGFLMSASAQFAAHRHPSPFTGSTLPGHPLQAEPFQAAAASSCQLQGPCRTKSFSSSVEPAARWRSNENVAARRRWSTVSGQDCLVHYEPCDTGDGVRRMSFKKSSFNQDMKSASQQKRFAYQVLQNSSAVLPASHSSSTVQPSLKYCQRAEVNGQLAGGTRQPRNDSISSTFRAYSNLAVACSDIDDADDDDDSGSRGTARTTASVGSLANVVSQRPVVKFSSLPNMEQLEKLGTLNPIGDSGAVSSANKAVANKDQTSNFVSMPCISAYDGDNDVRASRRCLPSLSIPKEVVEAKRLSLSQQLNEKLIKAARKRADSGTKPNRRIKSKKKKVPTATLR